MESLNHIALLLNIVVAGYYMPFKAILSDAAIVDGLDMGTLETYINTSRYVYHLEEDAFVPGNILYTDSFTVMTTDGKNAHLVAGSVKGYAEGVSTQAKFEALTGFLQTMSSQVLLVDCDNHCLRYLNRITNQTSLFVGTCTSGGFGNGRSRNSRFLWPFAVIRNSLNLHAAIVTDSGNNALRTLDLGTGDVTTLIKGLPSPPQVAAFDSVKENIFITFPDFLGKVNVKTLIFTPITSITNRGGNDGEFSKASFGYGRGILCMNKACLVADQGLNKLRIFNAARQEVTSICTGASASVDGTARNCSFRQPFSLLLKSDTMYIGEYMAIRKMSVRERFPCADITARITTGEKEKCLEVIPGHNICLTPGISRYNIPEKNCSIKISISKEHDACQNAPCLNAGLCTAGDHNTYTCACRDRWTGSHCQTEINACTFNPCRNGGRCTVSNSTSSCSCSAGWTGILCEKELDVCQNNPCVFGICAPGDNKTYTCFCSDGWTGRHCQTRNNACSLNPCRNFGRCLAIHNTFTCSCIAGWTGIICEKELQNITCVREIYGAADVNTMTKVIALPDGNNIKLPVGRFIYQQQLPDDTLCEIAVTVADPRLKMRIDFYANYELACNLFNDFKELTFSLATSRYSQISQLSSELCNRSAEVEVMITCTKDNVQVIWPTDCLFGSSQLNEKQRVLKAVHENLLKTKVFHLELVIPNHIPPIIQPTLNQEGLPASIMMTPVCPGGLTYLKATDACQ